MRRYGALMGATALYWHFMDGLWVYLFILLFLWR
jgi:heme/copper-type cytochrome/quinol oxidase subunit 3